MNRIVLASRLLFRDGRAGELTLLLVALVIAVTGTTAITLFADRLHRTMTAQAADFLAADLVISSSQKIPRAWLEKAGQLHLKSAESTEFSSVLIENDELLLAGVKAVSANYPLRGFLKITGTAFKAAQTVHAGPAGGEVWVDQRILSMLRLKIGDTLTVGEKALIISHILTYEPDKKGNLYSLSPRVMMSASDLAATRVIQPGSHVHYFFQFSGSADAIGAFNHWLKPRLEPGQRLLDIHEDRPELGTALTRAERYLGLSSVVVILIAGVAIATATRRYSERHFNATAVLRCLGCTRRDILWLYISQFLLLGMLGSISGCLFGWFIQEALFHLLQNLLPGQLAKPGLLAVFFGFVAGLAIFFAFALPPLLRLQRVSPLRVLRRDLEPLPTGAWLVYGLAVGLIGLFIWRYTDNLTQTLSILGGGAIALCILSLLVRGLLLLAEKSVPRLNITWRFGVQGLTRNTGASVNQIVAFSVTLVAMTLSFTVRNDLLDNWRQQLPEDTPNYFLLNIFPDQQASLQQALLNHKIKGSRFYPVVRGRLVTINDTPVQRIVSKDSQGERATHRDLSLTWSASLPEDNRISAGQWWRAAQTGQVSIEQQLADNLNVGLGDKLAFTVGSEQFDATVTSIRSLRWDTLKPNFYMIFSPGTLDHFANTFITSFYLPEAQKYLLNDWVKSYRGITVLEVDALLKQFKSILAQLTEAIDYLLYFALLAGFTVLFAAVRASLDQRLHEGALMRTLGAGRTFLRQTQFIEFALTGFCAGLLAVVLSESIIFALYRQVLELTYSPNPILWLVLPIGSAALVGLSGYWGVKEVANRAPLAVLREAE